MTRIAFNRKNKILQSMFSQKCVAAVLEQNYKLHCNVNNKVKERKIISKIKKK